MANAARNQFEVSSIQRDQFPSSEKLTRRRKNSTSGTCLEDLPESLLVEILIRLPCKLCFKCKSVSKRWLSLISQPYFVVQFICHREKPSSSFLLNPGDNYKDGKRIGAASDSLPITLVLDTGGVLVWDPVFKSPGFNLSYLPCFRSIDHVPIFVAASCKDLLLCRSPSPFCWPFWSSTYYEDYYICNPLTMQWALLPRPRKIYCVEHLGLVLGPLSSGDGSNGGGNVDYNVSCGFKVVRLANVEGSDTSFQFDIFSSELGEWSEPEVVQCPPGFVSEFRKSQAAPSSSGLFLFRTSGLILYNAFEKSWAFFNLPEDGHLHGRRGRADCYATFKGRIRVAFSFLDRRNPYFTVWEVVDSSDMGKWSLVHKVHVKDVNSTDASLAQYVKSSRMAFSVLIFHPDDGHLVYLDFGTRIALYNIRSNMLTLVTRARRPKWSGHSTFRPLQLQWWPTPVKVIPTEFSSVSPRTEEGLAAPDCHSTAFQLCL